MDCSSNATKVAFGVLMEEGLGRVSGYCKLIVSQMVMDGCSSFTEKSQKRYNWFSHRL